MPCQFEDRFTGDSWKDAPIELRGDDFVIDDKEDVHRAHFLDVLSLDLGDELVGLVDTKTGGTLLDRVAGLRREVAKEMGIIVPPVHVCDNLELEANGYRIMLLGSSIGQGTCNAGRLLAIDPSGNAPPLEGDATIEPTYGMPARWVLPRDRSGPL